MAGGLDLLLRRAGRPSPRVATRVAVPLIRLYQHQISHAPSIGGLGYRGFLIESRDPDIPPSLLVFNRVITVNPGPKAEYWRDSTDVEDWLLSEAERHDYGELLRAAGVRGGSGGESPATAT
jgi:hypothetical protein